MFFEIFEELSESFFRLCIICWRRILGFFEIFEDLSDFTLGFQRFCKDF